MSPTLGRAVEPDPLGFGAGDADFYRWEGDRPTGVTDPSGLDWDDYLPQAYWDDPLLKALRRYWRSFGTAVSGSSGGLTFQALPDGAGGTGIGGWGGAGSGGAGGGGAGWPGGWGPNAGAINAAGQWLWAQVTSLFGHPSPTNWPSLKAVSDYFAGWADTLTGGATAQLRQAGGYDDAVDHNSKYYKGGRVTGEIHLVAMDLVSLGGMFRGGGMVSPGRGGGGASGRGSGASASGLPAGFNPAKGFKTFEDFKRAFGSAGKGQAWHHIVEQTVNSGKFAPEILHNPANLIKLPHGKGSIHAKISGYYSSKPNWAGGLKVRDWIAKKSFKEQFEFGVKTIKQFGGAQYLPPGLR